MLKNWRKFEITEILYKIFANFLKRKEPTFTSQLRKKNLNYLYKFTKNFLNEVFYHKRIVRIV